MKVLHLVLFVVAICMFVWVAKEVTTGCVKMLSVKPGTKWAYYLSKDRDNNDPFRTEAEKPFYIATVLETRKFYVRYSFIYTHSPNVVHFDSESVWGFVINSEKIE